MRFFPSTACPPLLFAMVVAVAVVSTIFVVAGCTPSSHGGLVVATV